MSRKVILIDIFGIIMYNFHCIYAFGVEYMYKILICDDNPVFLGECENYIKEVMGERNHIVFPVKSAEEAVALIGKNNLFDIAVLDIEMSGKNGIELASELNSVCPECRIIFLTNYIEYATAVYQTDHSYFVIKNDMKSSLPKAVEKAVAEIEKHRDDFITLSFRGKETVIRVCDIKYCERNMRTTDIFLKDENITVKENLDKLYDILKGSGFSRCHNSFIVNMDYIKELYRDKYILTDDTEIPISRSHSDETRTDFAKFMCNMG